MTIKRVTLIFIIALPLIIVLRWIFEIHALKFDSITMTLLLIIIGIAYIPFASDIGILGIFRFKQLEKDVKHLGSNFYKGKVVINKGVEYYIDSMGVYHDLPDDNTRNFLMGQEGILEIKKSELRNFKKGEKLEKVLNSKYVIWDTKAGQKHQFIIFGNKKYHVPSASFFADWGWEGKEPEPISTEEIRSYKTGK